MTVYLNMRSSYGVETVDEFSSEEFQEWNSKSEKPYKSFLAYVQEMISEYHLSSMNVYRSQRCTKDWRIR